MKLSLFVLAFAAASTFAGVTVKSARYNYINGTLSADLAFGGCKTPKFAIKFADGCFETNPPQSDATISQVAGDDGCERLNLRTVSFPLAGDPCPGVHYVNVSGTDRNAESVRVKIDPTLE